MNEWFLWVAVGSLTFVAVSVALYPFRKQRGLVFVLLLVMSTVLMGAYMHWGEGVVWQTFVRRQAILHDVQSMLDSNERTTALIQRIQTRLTKTPSSARGWYLIGKLYLLQHEQTHAQEAFALAHQLNPDDEQIALHYAQCLWEVNQHAFNRESRQLLHDVLKKNPDQTDALAMLAMDAFSTKHYKTAIAYWERLLRLIPPQSDEYQAIHRTIEQAKTYVSK